MNNHRNSQHPLISAVQLRDIAIRKRAHWRFIERLQAIVDYEAREVRSRFAKTEDVFPVLAALRPKLGEKP